MMVGKLYTKQGWLDWQYIYEKTNAFTMVVGARGTGKTFGLLKYIVQHDLTFMYVRRLKTQVDQCCTLQSNPFKAVNRATGVQILPRARKSGVTFYKQCGQENKIVGYGVALSTFATLRGVDYSNVDCIVFDQAVPMSTEKPIRDQFNAFLNLYQTVNRNRELLGNNPVKCFLLGNANKLANPYFTGWRFMTTALNMINGRQSMWTSPDGTRNMIMLVDSPISQQKKRTALYKNSNQQFDKMALGNSFLTDPTTIKSMPLKQFNHVCSVGEIGIYKHKSRSIIYVSKTISKNNYYNAYGMELDLWRNKYILFKSLYYSRMIIFQSFNVQLIFRQLTL